MTPSKLNAAFQLTLDAARRSFNAGDLSGAFVQLERAHVLGQRRFVRHLTVHLWMLRIGWASRDGREVRGQLLRTALVPLGHLLGRLPIGNTGGSRVSAFTQMPVDDDLRALLDDEEAKSKGRLSG